MGLTICETHSIYLTFNAFLGLFSILSSFREDSPFWKRPVRAGLAYLEETCKSRRTSPICLSFSLLQDFESAKSFFVSSGVLCERLFFLAVTS